MQLSCYCRSFDLDQAPLYEALSYVWGFDIPAIKSQILFETEVLSIGSSLANALTRLRLRNSIRVLWVDALCINQKDDDEKNRQVLLMGSIYLLARRTVVWLGHGDSKTTKKKFRCIREIAGACREYAGTHTLGRAARNRYGPLKPPVDWFRYSVCDGLKDLYDLQWFWRVWYVQEICLARDAVAIWEAEMIAWSHVSLATSWMTDNRLVNQRDDQVVRLIYSVPCVIAGMMCLTSSTQTPLLDVLRQFRGRQCTYIKDRVHGPLGLVTDEEAQYIVVDYSKTAGEVYAETVLATIRLRSRLTALGAVSHPEEYAAVEGTPSWAPCWNDWNPVVRMGLSDEYCPWSTCSNEHVRHTDTCDMSSTRLFLTDIRYCTVRDVDNIMWDLEYHERDLFHPFKTALRRASGRELPILTQEKLARTLTTEQSGENFVQNVSEDQQTTFYRSFSTFMSTLRTYKELDQQSAIFREDAYLYCSDRRVFYTENSSYGLGPRCMRPDDVVVVLYRSNTPYILRPQGNSYLFMGQAYVDEIMNGELVREVKAGKRQEERFCVVQKKWLSSGHQHSRTTDAHRAKLQLATLILNVKFLHISVYTWVS
jgi:hypothetical protein